MRFPRRFVALAAIVLAGCASATEQSASTSPIADVVSKTASEMGLPAAFALIDQRGEMTVVSHGFITDDVPPAATTHFRVGSNTKTWTGTVVLQLVDEGLLRLDDPVSKFRDDVPEGDAITIEMLLGMRSGLANYSLTEEFNAALDADPSRIWSSDELIDLGLAQPPVAAPDEGFNYSNTNTVLLGTIIEELENEPLSEVFERRLFEPLGMDSSQLPGRSDETIPAPFAPGFTFGTNVETRDGAPALNETEQEAFLAGDLEPDDHTFDNPSWADAAGAGISTAEDLARWVEALASGELLSSELQSARLQLKPQAPDAPSDAPTYGLAIADFGGYLGHTGELPGYNSFMGHNPDTDTTVVVWANLAPTGDGLDPATEIARSIIGVLADREAS